MTPPDPRWLRPLLKPLRPAFREVVLLSLFVNVLALAAPVFVLQVYDRVVLYAGLTTLQGLVAGMAIVIAFDLLVRQARSRILQRVALSIDARLGRDLYERLLSLPLRVAENRPGAYWQALFRDADTVRNTFSGASAVLIADLPFAILFAGFIVLIAFPVAWVLLVILPLFVVLAWRSGATVSAASLEERSAQYEREALLAETVAGRTTVHALALGDAIRPLWETRHARAIEAALGRGARADGYVNLGMELTVITTVALTAVGALAIIDQRLSIGALIAANMLSSRIVSPFQQLVGTWRAFAQTRHAMRRLSEAFSLPAVRAESHVLLERPKGEITLEGVRFAYEDGAAPALDGVGLRLGPGGLHAVIGRNGSGKSTLIKLMLGLYAPDRGRVLLDGADIAQFARPDLARWMGYVAQETFLFAGTIRDNLAKARPDADDEAIVRAAKLAGVHDFILDLPDGYGTEIGEAGRRLSGGMRQRLAIARALMGDPALLVLDEPTAGLDRQAEEALRKTLVDLAATHTVILVTHSPVILTACTSIMALERGRIALAGPAGEVLPRLFPIAKRAQPETGV